MEGEKRVAAEEVKRANEKAAEEHCKVTEREMACFCHLPLNKNEKRKHGRSPKKK